MTRPRRVVTFVVHRDGDLSSRTYTLPLWLYQVLKVSTAVVVVLGILGAILYTPVARTAAKVPGLNRELERLSAENRQVSQLARTLDALEARYDQVRTALGANVLPELSDSASGYPVAHTVHAQPANTLLRYAPGPSLPVFWPLDSVYHPGVITRGLVPEGSPGEAHRGIDIAVPTGTPIRAAGGGNVAQAGYDREYGLFVLIDHPGGYQTMYGHASRLLVSAGQDVDAGQVIALAGNTGRSTAPHLHFEKRRGHQPIDPMLKIP